MTQVLGDDGVLLVTLNRPDRRNAIDDAMADALRAVFERAAGDAGVHAVIVTGEGRAFSAGGDLSRFERDWDPREFRHESHRLTQLISGVERLEKPTVAAINGVATGAGTQLALACDVRLIAAGTRFVYREGRLGIIPSHGGVTRLVKLIGLARAREPMRWREAAQIFGSAAIAMALGMTLILQAMKHGQAGLVAILSSVTPIVVLPLLWLVYRRRPAWGAWAGAALAVVGTALVLG